MRNLISMKDHFEASKQQPVVVIAFVRQSNVFVFRLEPKRIKLFARVDKDACWGLQGHKLLGASVPACVGSNLQLGVFKGECVAAERRSEVNCCRQQIALCFHNSLPL